MLSLLSFTKAFVVRGGGLRKKMSNTPQPELGGQDTCVQLKSMKMESGIKGRVKIFYITNVLLLEISMMI